VRSREHLVQSEATRVVNILIDFRSEAADSKIQWIIILKYTTVFFSKF